jgi:hypothetical protein
MNSTDTKNLAALEKLLERVHGEHPAIAEDMREALAICQSRSVVHAGINFELQTALASLRTGRPEDAAASIKCALDIHAHWVGAVTA